ncbi:MAG: pitrilysin family protein [Gammaproteobacteria bacterium]|nr:pitrilysin family protein [Gammaproteobacteria bacterium]
MGLLAGSSAAAAAAPVALPKGVQYVTSVEGISEYRLDNGLRVLLFPDPSKQTFTVNITYLVGSRHESYGETGMAHLLEHLVFKGTPRHPNIPEELTRRGARPNGTTGFDRTNYFATFAATEDNLRWALDLEADRMVNSFIAKRDLDTEMTVVRNEFEMSENDPAQVLQKQVFAAAYQWHNYGNTPIGSRADVENVPIDRLQAFYRTWYQPDNAVLLIAGKFEPAVALALVAQYFGPIPRPQRKLPVLYTDEPDQDGERFVAVRRVSDAQYVMAAFHVPSGAHPDTALLPLLANVLADDPAGRLYKRLVESKQAAAVFGFGLQLHDPGLFVVGAQVRREADVDAARSTLLKTVDELRARPITRDELERARAQALKQIELNLNHSERIGLALSNWIGIGDWRLMFLNRDRIRNATLEDLQRVAATYLLPHNRTVGVSYATDKVERVAIPAAPPIADLVAGYTGDAPRTEGEAFDPSPANIDARTLRSTLPSGLQVALLPKRTRGGSVHATLTLRFGDLQSLRERRQVAALTAAMLMRGTARLTREQLNAELDRLKARVNVAGQGAATTVTIETVREQFPAVLTLVAEIVQRPAFADREVDLLKQELIAANEAQSKEPTVLGQVALTKHLLPYAASDIRYTAGPQETIAEIGAVTAAAVRDFHRQFYGASQGELVVVGDIAAGAIATLANQLFGGWRSASRYERIPRQHFDVPGRVESLQTPDKANAFLIAGLGMPMRDDDADYPAMVLGNYMLGGGFLNSRLATRLRQKEGLSYGVGSLFDAGSFEPAALLLSFAIYAPQNAARVETAMREELRKVVEHGFTAEEVAAAKSGWLQSRQVSRAQDQELARSLARLLFAGRTMAWEAALEQKVGALTPGDVNAAMKKHVALDKLSIVKAGDFAAGGGRLAP